MSDNDQTDATPSREQAAADLIRHKLDALYTEEEPDARQEIAELKQLSQPLSKHQRFMQQLTTSGRPLAEIQADWHAYYASLADAEKHAVWQEFYAQHGTPATTPSVKPQPTPDESTTQPVASQTFPTLTPETTQRSVRDVKRRLAHRQGRRHTKPKEHLQSLLFGVGIGSLVVLILLFGFFNERFIAPFITPSRAVSNTPIIIDPNNAAVGPAPEIIIPKINVEIPVVYDQPSIEEAAVQKSLENGVVHYATTPKPGELGNAVIFGHSSNNILNHGKYKFAFVLLSRLENGDTFMLNYNSKRYIYQVIDKKIVDPTDVGVIGPVQDQAATATLITCDPPGTSLHRLIVVGKQISPDPSANTKSTASPTAKQPTIIPSNAPSLWSRLWNDLFH